ncbi:hypothetical protein QW131_26090 [Roseibium salinum]|nr:hypothetical protein [Roseibium salinum]
MVAGMGDLTREVLPETLMASDEDVAYHLKGDSLYVHIPLMMDVDGHHLSAVTKQPVDTLQKVEDTYSRLFTPFLIYTGILAIGAALIVNRITTTGLARLLTYAMSLRQDRVVNVPAPGFIVEFNQLATMFQAAFEIHSQPRGPVQGDDRRLPARSSGACRQPDPLRQRGIAEDPRI